MSGPSQTKGRSIASAPEKGSFPLDHFKECTDIIEKYLTCINKHELMPKRCQKIQLEYLNCRMENGLMKKESMEDLGFTRQNTYETELERKKALIMQFAQVEKEVRTNVQNFFLQKDLEESSDKKVEFKDYLNDQKDNKNK